MNMDEALPDDEHFAAPSADVAAEVATVASRPSNNYNQQRDLSFDMRERSDHTPTESPIVTRNTGSSGKVLLLLIAAVALVCSIYTALSCKFLIIQGAPSSSLSSTLSTIKAELVPLANTTTTVAIGIFSFSTLDDHDKTNPLDFASYCIPYENQFWESDRGPLFWSAQLSALLAPCVGGLALMIQLVEIMRRHFLRNFLLVVFLYLMASLIQGYTFAIYGAMDFCWQEEEIECTLSESGYSSVVAAASYYLCIILMCCVPRQSIQIEQSNYKQNKTIVSEQQDPMVHHHHHTSSASIGVMEEGQRSVRFEDPPVSQTVTILE